MKGIVAESRPIREAPRWLSLTVGAAAMVVGGVIISVVNRPTYDLRLGARIEHLQQLRKGQCFERFVLGQIVTDADGGTASFKFGGQGYIAMDGQVSGIPSPNAIMPSVVIGYDSDGVESGRMYTVADENKESLNKMLPPGWSFDKNLFVESELSMPPDPQSNSYAQVARCPD